MGGSGGDGPTEQEEARRRLDARVAKPGPEERRLELVRLVKHLDDAELPAVGEAAAGYVGAVRRLLVDRPGLRVGDASR